MSVMYELLNGLGEIPNREGANPHPVFLTHFSFGTSKDLFFAKKRDFV